MNDGSPLRLRGVVAAPRTLSAPTPARRPHAVGLGLPRDHRVRLHGGHDVRLPGFPDGLKNVLATVVNAVAALVFVLVAFDRIDWLVVLLIAVGSTVGGVIGSTVGRRLPQNVLRAAIVVIGLVAVTRMVVAG